MIKEIRVDPTSALWRNGALMRSRLRVASRGQRHAEFARQLHEIRDGVGRKVQTLDAV